MESNQAIRADSETDEMMCEPCRPLIEFAVAQFFGLEDEGRRVRSSLDLSSEQRSHSSRAIKFRGGLIPVVENSTSLIVRKQGQLRNRKRIIRTRPKQHAQLIKNSASICHIDRITIKGKMRRIA